MFAENTNGGPRSGLPFSLKIANDTLNTSQRLKCGGSAIHYGSNANSGEDEMFKIARKNGMLTMKEDAIIKAAQGVIPFEEVNTLGGQFELPEELPEIDKLAKPVAIDEETADTGADAVTITPGTKKEIDL